MSMTVATQINAVKADNNGNAWASLVALPAISWYNIHHGTENGITNLVTILSFAALNNVTVTVAIDDSVNIVEATIGNIEEFPPP